MCHLSKMCVMHWMCYYTELLVGRPCATSLRKGLVWCGATLLLYIWSPGNLLYLLPCVASAGSCCCLNIRARSSLRFDRYPVSARCRRVRSSVSTARRFHVSVAVILGSPFFVVCYIMRVNPTCFNYSGCLHSQIAVCYCVLPYGISAGRVSFHFAQHGELA